MLQIVPLELKEANAFVQAHHRHHQPVYRDKFRCGCVDSRGKLCGVIQVGRPVSRILDDGITLEVVRLCTLGERNACTLLFSRAARAAKTLGYKHIITYVLETENGSALKAAGWSIEAKTSGGAWDCPSRPRQTTAPTCPKIRWGLWL